EGEEPMTAPAPSCETFTHEHLDPAQPGCPVRGCKARLSTAPYRGSPIPWCPRHGIRLHGKPGSRRTFVYWNGPDSDDDSLLRNFPVEREFLETHPLRELGKAESHRLGHENAEDAVTWNVFAGLLAAGCLGRAVTALTGFSPSEAPQLWLWGRRIDLGREFGPLYEPLARLRERLEHDVDPFQTEPDVMILVPKKLLVLVEAKFTSGNSLAVDKQARKGEKPKDQKGLVAKYLPAGSDPGAIVPQRIAAPFHGQLFRNVVFAQAMAHEPAMQGAEWAVVNLVSDTQWKKARKSAPNSRKRRADPETSFEDPTPAVHSWLREDSRSRFRFSSWERLFEAVIRGTPQLRAVESYLRGKSAHLEKAFVLT
ncbi:MAG TPA: hypothetical protein VEN81_02890, partial [Planctomycetota bacterium]|nr:hypothetical protein [Planctomycetota bacterium]